MKWGTYLFLFFLAGCLAWPGKAAGQLITVRSELERDSLMIGDQLDYSLVVEARENVEFTLPQIGDTLSRHLEVLELLDTDSTYSEGRKRVTKRYRITSFEAGVHMIPSQPVIYITGDIRDTARSMPVMVRVHEPEVDLSAEIRPIKPPINTPLTFRELLPWIGLGVLVLVLATTIYILIRRARRRQADPEGIRSRPQEPAHVLAFRELDRLKEEKLWEKGEVKSFYTQLTEIIRQYIELQYTIPAMESTTTEILTAFRRSNREDGLLDEMLQELLETADLVKFAKEDPLPMDNRTHLNNAYIFVQKTYPLFYREEEVKHE